MKKTKLKELFTKPASKKKKYAIDIELLVNTGVKRFNELGWDGINYLATMVAQKRGYNISSFVSEVKNSIHFRRDLIGF